MNNVNDFVSFFFRDCVQVRFDSQYPLMWTEKKIYGSSSETVIERTNDLIFIHV